MNIQKHIEKIIKTEGGYSDNSDDSGGQTNFGITEGVAYENGYRGEMINLKEPDAKRIYAQVYYIKPGFALIAEYSDAIAYELFDTGVNMGPKRACKWLQRCLNVLNRSQLNYNDLKVDGKIGKRTSLALSTFIFNRRTDGENVMLRALNCLQGAAYIDLAERREKDETFVYGWLLNRVVIT